MLHTQAMAVGCCRAMSMVGGIRHPRIKAAAFFFKH
jgi:hypothetical protein